MEVYIDGEAFHHFQDCDHLDADDFETSHRKAARADGLAPCQACTVRLSLKCEEVAR